MVDIVNREIRRVPLEKSGFYISVTNEKRVLGPLRRVLEDPKWSAYFNFQPILCSRYNFNRRNRNAGRTLFLRLSPERPGGFPSNLAYALHLGSSRIGTI